MEVAPTGGAFTGGTIEFNGAEAASGASGIGTGTGAAAGIAGRAAAMVVGSTEIAGAMVSGFWLGATAELDDDEIFVGRERMPVCESEAGPLVKAAEDALFGGASGFVGGATTFGVVAGLFAGTAADEPS